MKNVENKFQGIQREKKFPLETFLTNFIYEIL